MQGKLTQAKLIQIVIVLAILMAAFAYRTMRHESEPAKQQVTDIQNCDLSHSGCRLNRDGYSLVVTVEPPPIRAELPFVIKIEGLPRRPGKAWIEGRDMFMGRIPLTLRQEQGIWLTDAMVGACTEHRMVWQLVVEIEGETPLYIPFTVTR
ncbi:hypothetical protein [Aeromonas diversa]|uniref:hypothetical protein n=1 Tax=Aeromonas diversa TaxID=502790 RepID=UPI0034630789